MTEQEEHEELLNLLLRGRISDKFENYDFNFDDPCFAVGQGDDVFFTPLAWAVIALDRKDGVRSFNVVQYLLAHGARPGYRGKGSSTPLTYCSHNLDTQKALIVAGDLNDQTKVTIARFFKDYGRRWSLPTQLEVIRALGWWHPAMLASALTSVPLVRALIEQEVPMLLCLHDEQEQRGDWRLVFSTHPRSIISLFPKYWNP